MLFTNALCLWAILYTDDVVMGYAHADVLWLWAMLYADGLCG